MGHKTVLIPSEVANVAMQFNTPLVAHQAVGAAAKIASRIIDKPSIVRDFEVQIETCGTAAGPSTVMLKKIPAAGGAAVDILAAAVSIAHDDADGKRVKKVAADFVSEAVSKLEPGDILQIEVTAAATNMAGLNACANVDQRFDDPVAKPVYGVGGGTP